jgi:hypothetical protein
MGTFSFGTEVVTIPSTPNIVLERLRIDRGEREQYRLHRSVSYYDDETARTYVVPPGEEFGDFETDLASVPQLFTWLVPKSGNHLAAALVHDHLVDLDPRRYGDQIGVDRHVADRIFRDAMGDLDVGFIRRWLMWTAVSIKTIEKRGTTPQRVGAFGSLALIVVLGALATANLFTDHTLVPWMGDRGVAAEIALGLAGAVVIPIVLGALLWSPIRIAGVIAGVALSLLLHAMALLFVTYLAYSWVERWPRRLQAVVAAVVVLAAAAGFAYGVITAVA